MDNIFEHKNAMAEAARPAGQKIVPEQAAFDENGLGRELWPYRDEMHEWAGKHLDDFGSFLEYRNAKFKLVCGTGFYHEPGKDIISLSVPFYKGCREAGEMTIDQIFFASLHEFAHLKTMLELDRAGKKNQMQQFVYEKNKTIRDKKDSARFATLGSTYRQFYNIMEDAIVNRLVLSTRHYSESGSDASKGRHQEIKDLYTDKFFPVFREVGEGNGEYIANPNKAEKKDKPYLHVEKGAGNLVAVAAEDYEVGFDWKKMVPKMERSGQLLTFFMKNQMIGLKKEEIYDEVENPLGTHELHPDVALALTRPLPETYAMLLQKIAEKYRDDPAQAKRYGDFMTQATRIEVFAERKGQVVAENPDVVVNVCNPNVLRQGTLEINHALAKSQYVEKLKKAAQKIGSTDPRALTYLEVFNHYKDTIRSKEYSWTFPLQHNLLERTRMTREVLEPIFTMLCILDDSFDVELPPETRPNNPEPSKEKQEQQENHEKPDWKEGDKVINDDKKSPFYGKKGVITKKTIVNGKIESVTVEYLEEEKNAMAQSAGKKNVLTGEIEEVYNPDENLALWVDKSQSEEKQKSEFEDKRKRQYEEEKKKKGDNGDEDDDADKKNADTQPPLQPEEPKDGSKDGKAKDLGEVLESLEEKYLKALLEQDERDATLKEIEDQKKTVQYQEKKGDLHRAQQLLEQLRKERQSKGEAQPGDPDFSDKEIVKKYLALEKKAAPYADRMAQSWLEVVNNIASKIEAVKDRYYRSGKIDYKKLQRYFPELEMGVEIDQRLIYERIVEKVITEVKPQMLRILLLVDNSGSMRGAKLENTQMAIMLLNSSLRSLRLLFKDKMQEIFGTDYRQDFDLVCDSEIRLFGSKSQLIKAFDVQELAFLEDESLERPAIDVNREIGNTLYAFQKMTANENTYDNRAWGEIFLSHNEEKFKQLVKDNKLTEAIFQISDGAIMDSDTESSLVAISLIKSLRDEIGVGVGGFAIGESESDQEAYQALSERHGAENVIPASTPDQIVSEFGKLLQKIIVEKIEQPMEEYLENMGQESE